MAKRGVLFGAMMALVVFAAPALAESVQVRGSSIFLPVAERLVERFMNANPGSRIIVSGGGSWWGFKTVFDGTADLGMVSSDIIPEDLDEESKESGKALQRRPFAQFAVVPVVHSSNPVSGLSLAQLHDIYVGRITNWKEVGGASAPIHVVAAEDVGSGIFQVWATKVLGAGAVATPSAREVAAVEMRAAVARDPLAIGYEALGRVASGIKPLRIDGLEAKEDSLADGRWPISGTIALIYFEPLSASAKAFFDYCLGEAGRAEIGAIHGAFLAAPAEEAR